MKTEKNKIAEALKQYCDQLGSQNKASKTLQGVSSATITQILKGNWELINESMWRKIATQIGYKTESWVSVETANYKMMHSLLNDSQTYNTVYAITGDAGSGKSFAMSEYKSNNKGVYLLKCSKYWKSKHFLKKLLQAMGRNANGMDVVEMFDKVIEELQQEDHPLIVLDEADKLSDSVFSFFIELYNGLEDCCGLVMCATNHLEKRIRRGLKLNREGYNEVYSRIGRKFIELDGINSNDVVSICVLNGVEDKKDIKAVVEDCEWDLRRVKRKIHAIKNMN